MPADWPSLWRNEDWWAVWLGFLVLGLFASGTIRWIPKIGIWTSLPTSSISAIDAPYLMVLGVSLLALTSVAILAMGGKVREFLTGFPVVFVLGLLALIIASQKAIKIEYGLEYPIWALLLSLATSNLVSIPDWLKSAARTELFIKIGLVLLGAEVLFQTILKAGIAGMAQAIIVVIVVWYFCYFVALKAGLTKSFASILSTGVSICGVSAAIAAGGAVKGDPKEVSYTVSLILLIAIPMLIGQPFIARYFALPSAVAGAWIGGTIDTTPAVVAAGALYGEEALRYATVVKLSQNILIGVAAFGLALHWAVEVNKKNRTVRERPSPMEIWYRFPKFILGFILASVGFSLLLTPLMGEKAVGSVTALTSGIRGWFFALAFVAIGLNTKFSELAKMGGGKPALVFVAAQVVNLFVTFGLAWMFFGDMITR